jgi:hypothetical protein
VALDVAAEADAVTADLRALAPELTWVRRSWLGPCPEEMAAFVDRHAGQLPAVAVGETGAKLATGTKRPPRRHGRPRPAPAGGLA